VSARRTEERRRLTNEARRCLQKKGHKRFGKAQYEGGEKRKREGADVRLQERKRRGRYLTPPPPMRSELSPKVKVMFR
jgi:hypothetical protein